MRLKTSGIPIHLATVALVVGCSGSSLVGGDEGGSSGEMGGSGGEDSPSGEDGPSGSDGSQEPGEVPGAAGDDGCLSNREFLATQAWPQVLGSVCLSCHGPGGIAANQSAAFQLQPSAYPGFLDVNLEQVSSNAHIESNNVSVVLLKPLGELSHGGGAVLAPDSEQYAILEELVERVNEPDPCGETGANVATFEDVELLSPQDTFRKAALSLVGRLPKSAEKSAIREGGEDAILPTLRGLYEDDAFYERLVEMFNDQWLTDRYLNNSQNLLRDEDFPNVDTYYESLSDEQRTEARTSVAREPLELMAYIVRNDRPFSEIVTADYTVLNPYTAIVYNNDDMDFEEVYDARGFQEGKIFAIREGSRVAFPHAGILTSPMFLNRYPTSSTNRNRHRARIVLRELLATDILRVADRPIDPTKAVSFANPTREEASCSMCHVTLDPIAGAFQKFDENDYERYRPELEWHDEMYAPGFGEEKMMLDDFDAAPQWLGKRIARDPRFPLSVVRNMYETMIGQEPLDFPADPSDGSYPSWEAQDSTIRAITEAFVASDLNLKVVIEQLVMSPYFRAANTSATDAGRLAQLGAVGTGRLLTPELLDRKIAAVFGSQWMDGTRPILQNGLRILYGGIDSDSVTARLTVPNGMMSAIMWRASTELSCRNAPLDFSKAADKRRLFPHVELDTVPEDEVGEPIEGNMTAIRENLGHLYSRLLGEKLVEGSAEEARVMDLFVKTWREGRAKLASEEVGRDLPYECQYRRAPGADSDLPEEEQLRRDETYAIRSWMAVLTYMIADYRFLYD